jgi:hypothetical protein
MNNINNIKEGDFVFIKLNSINTGNKSESYKTYVGIISYRSKTTIGFVRAVITEIYNDGKSYATPLTTCFSISASIVNEIIILN